MILSKMWALRIYVIKFNSSGNIFCKYQDFALRKKEQTSMEDKISKMLEFS